MAASELGEGRGWLGRGGWWAEWSPSSGVVVEAAELLGFWVVEASMTGVPREGGVGGWVGERRARQCMSAVG